MASKVKLSRHVYLRTQQVLGEGSVWMGWDSHLRTRRHALFLMVCSPLGRPQRRLRHVRSILVRNLNVPTCERLEDPLSICVYFTLHSPKCPDEGTDSNNAPTLVRYFPSLSLSPSLHSLAAVCLHISCRSAHSYLHQSARFWLIRKSIIM